MSRGYGSFLTGAQGAAGNQGTTGATGPQGATGVQGAAFIGSKIGANMNSTADQGFAINAISYIVTGIVVTNASVGLTVAVGGIYNAGSKSGPLVASTQGYSGLLAATTFANLTLNSTATTTVQTGATLFLSLTTPQGAAATADIYVFGEVLS